jgi:hypothetical protein
MPALLTLFLAHLIADFPLQTNYLYERKRHSTTGLLAHSGIHALTAFLLTGLRWDLWYVWLFLLLSHALTDWAKLNYKAPKQWLGFLLDQLIHLAVMVIIALWQPGLTGSLPSWVLLLAFCLAWIPAILMFIWVVSADVLRDQTPPPDWAVWTQKNMLGYSRLSGYPVLIITLLGLILT